MDDFSSCGKGMMILREFTKNSSFRHSVDLGGWVRRKGEGGGGGGGGGGVVVVVVVVVVVAVVVVVVVAFFLGGIKNQTNPRKNWGAAHLWQGLPFLSAPTLPPETRKK